jgi:hypothetical protein
LADPYYFWTLPCGTSLALSIEPLSDPLSLLSHLSPFSYLLFCSALLVRILRWNKILLESIAQPSMIVRRPLALVTVTSPLRRGPSAPPPQQYFKSPRSLVWSRVSCSSPEEVSRNSWRPLRQQQQEPRPPRYLKRALSQVDEQLRALINSHLLTISSPVPPSC